MKSEYCDVLAGFQLDARVAERGVGGGGAVDQILPYLFIGIILRLLVGLGQVGFLLTIREKDGPFGETMVRHR